MLQNTLVLHNIKGAKDTFFLKPPVTLYQRWPFIDFGRKKFIGNLGLRKINLLGLRVIGRSFFIKSNYFSRFSNRIRKRARFLFFREQFWQKNKRIKRALLLTRCFNKKFRGRFDLFFQRFGFSFLKNKKNLLFSSFSRNSGLTKKFYRTYYHYYVRRLFRLNLCKKARWYALHLKNQDLVFFRKSFKNLNHKCRSSLKRRVLLRRFRTLRYRNMSVFRDKKYRRLFYTFNKKDKHFKLLNKRFFLLINCNSKLKKKYLLKKLKRVKFFCFLNMLCLFKKFFEYRSFRANNFKLLAGFFQQYRLYVVNRLHWAIRGFSFRFSSLFRKLLLKSLRKRFFSKSCCIAKNFFSFKSQKYSFLFKFFKRFYRHKHFFVATAQSRRLFFKYSQTAVIADSKDMLIKQVRLEKAQLITLSTLVENVSRITRKGFRVFNTLPQTGHFFLFIARSLLKRGLLQRSYRFFFNYSYTNKLFFYQKTLMFFDFLRLMLQDPLFYTFKRGSFLSLQYADFFLAERLRILQTLILGLSSTFCGPVLNMNLLTQNKSFIFLSSVVAPLVNPEKLNQFILGQEPLTTIKKPTWVFTSPCFISNYFSAFECFVEFKPWHKSGKVYQVPVFIRNQQRRKFCFLKMFRQVLNTRPEHSRFEQAVLELSDFVVGGGLTLLRFTQFRESLKNTRPFIKYFKFLL